ncbi:MAG: tRNA (adenosine(37)-N6)-threonylcarbamoyltransferase complex ATPase subunit type 1 TsaE [Bacteroidota bacterium]
MEYILDGLDQLDKTAAQLLEAAGARKLWLFYGEIGAGKTSLIKELCRQLGVEDVVSSPTFSIVNEYQRQPDGQAIYHIDLYRLEQLEEALDIGIEEYLYSQSHCFVEWPQLIEDLELPETVKINIEILDNSSRKILFL